ncbi:16629_t:CDS:10 [Entrophospora sp. SA101]|nr:16629_t:CDS:10 [Entrophospora sp. SA101]
MSYKPVALGDINVGKTAFTIQTYDPKIAVSYKKQAIIDNQPCVLDVLETAAQEKLKNQIIRVKGSNKIPIILVGNKCERHTECEVLSEEGMNMTKRLGHEFVESSTKTFLNVERPFYTVVQMTEKKSIPEEEKWFKNQLKRECILFLDYNSFQNIEFIDEYANNGNLCDYLKSNFTIMDWNIKLKFAKQIASAVRYLHENKIVHRDLHSKNILIHNGNIKICDFGISKSLLDPSIESSKRLGTIRYSDPEYLNNAENYSRNEKSDIYSIGVLLWEISSGHAPFANKSIKFKDIILAIILGEREAIIKGTPRKYAEIYTACWQGNPDLRPHIHQVTRDLDNVDITDIVNLTGQTINELQGDSSLNSTELSFSAQINSLENRLKDLGKVDITDIIEGENDDLLYSTELPLSTRTNSLNNHLMTIQNTEPSKEKLKEIVENVKLSHKNAQLAKDESANEIKSTTAIKKKPLMIRIKDELIHYWDGTKLLGLEIKISTKLLYKLLKGHKLTRREYRQLRRTTTDLFRLVPFAVFIIVPFMEFLLPVVLKLFPNMLPSTFEDKFSKEEKKRKLLKVRLEMAKFLQETLEDTGAVGSKKAEAAKEFAEFFRKVRTTGEQANTEDLLRIANLFEDELTLDNLSRPQLVSMCRYMNINAFGTDNFLRFQIRARMKSIEEDDAMIMSEGVDSLTIPELQHACQSRGIRTIGVSPARLRSELNQWLDLHLNHKIPSTLLILSRAFSFPDRAELADQAEALQATLNSLPENLVNEVNEQVSEADGGVTYKQKLEVIEEQEELIAEEKAQKEKEEAGRKAQKEAQEAAKAGGVQVIKEEDDARMTELQLQELRAALSILSSKSAVLEEREALNEIKEDREEYKEDIEELKETGKEESKASHRLSERLEKMIQKIDKELEQYDSEVGSKLNLIQANESGQISVKDLEEALRIIKHTPGDNEKIQKIVKKLDVDADGLVFLDHISELCVEGEGLGVLVESEEKDGKGKKVKKPKKEDIVQS